MSPHGPPSWVRQSEIEGLDEDRRAALDALMDGLMPGDAAQGLPGARAAGAATFVSRLLGREPPVYAEVPAWRELYPRALAALDAAAAERGWSGLAQAAPDQVEALLRDLKAGIVAGFPGDLDQALVFRTLQRHCIQGCFADPRWGGNRDARMWRAIGYPLRPAAS